MTSLEDTQPLRSLQRETAVLEESIRNVVHEVGRVNESVHEIARGVGALQLTSERHAQSLERLFNDWQTGTAATATRMEKLEMRLAVVETTLERHKWPLGVLVTFIAGCLAVFFLFIWDAVKAAARNLPH